MVIQKKRQVEKERYFALFFIFLSIIIFLFPRDYKLKISISAGKFLFKPLVIIQEYLATLRNYQKERDYLYELFLRQNLILASLKKNVNFPLEDLEFLKTNFVIQKANIISRDYSLRKYLVIDKGLKDSVMVNFPVVTQEGVVGKVIAVSEELGIVETFHSPYSKISAKIQRNNYLTAVVCKNNVLYLDYLDENCDVMENDTIISTEIGGIFPEGLKIGVVKKIEKNQKGTLEVIIEPAVNLLKIDDVYILIRKEKKIRKDELEILLKQLELKLPDIKFLR